MFSQPKTSRLVISTVALSALTLLTLGQTAQAVPAGGEDIEYKDGETVLQGYVARPLTRDLIKRPAVLIIHNWMGVKDYEKRRADQVAELGYVAMAADIYGKGVRPAGPEEAGQLAGKFKADMPLFLQRMRVALETLKARPDVDPEKIVVMGYCFGGTGAVELAKAGEKLKGAVSFHGTLGAAKSMEEIEAIQTSLLILHGAVDPYSPRADMEAFQKQLDGAGKDYVVVHFANAVHSFTEKAAGDDPSKGAAYDAKADERSWNMFADFLAERLGPPTGGE